VDGHVTRAVPGRPNSSAWSRIAPLAGGAALAGAAAFVASNDPSTAGRRFPACGFHAATGLWCPGCGLTRATHHLLTGDLAAALSSNVFTPLILVAIVASWATWTLTAFGHPVRNPVLRLPAWSGPVFVVLLIAFGVLRNLPGDPWQSLAP
jgi:Protein of unknown function (DUF2752)